MENDEAPKETNEPEEIIEVNYPFDLTCKLLQLYEDPVYNKAELGEFYVEILLKILRSARYWRIEIPKWLIQRVKSLR